MKRVKCSFLHVIILYGFLITNISTASETISDTSKKILARDFDLVQLRISSGNVRVYPSNDQWLYIEGNAALFSIEESNRVVLIRSNSEESPAHSLKLNIAMPVDKGLRGDLFSANGEFTSLSNELLLTSTSGNIVINEHRGAIDVTTISGDVAASLYPGRHHIQTVSGAVEYSSYESELSVKSLSGSLNVHGIRLIRSKIHSASGPIELNFYEGLGSDVRVSTLRGKIQSAFSFSPNNIAIELGERAKLANNLTSAADFDRSGNTHWLGSKDSATMVLTSHAGVVTLSQGKSENEILNKLQREGLGYKAWPLQLAFDVSNKNHSYAIDKSGIEKSLQIVLDKLIKSSSIVLAFEEKGDQASSTELMISRQNNREEAVVTRGFVGDSGKTKNIPLSENNKGVSVRLELNQKRNGVYEHELWLEGVRYPFSTTRVLHRLNAELLNGAAEINVIEERSDED